MTIHLVTFHDASMSRSAELCTVTAKAYGQVDSTWIYEPAAVADARLDMEPWRAMEWLNQRGCGFWWWKPQIILDALSGSSRTQLRNPPSDGDIVIYADAGVEFIGNVNYIIDRMDQDIFLFGNQYEHKAWCKADIIDEVWHPAWEDYGKQVQASVIFFRVSNYTRKFVKEWLDWCLFEGGRLIDDSPSRAPNHPEFQENRHDQAILTTLAYREGIRLHYWPAQYNDGAFEYPRGDYPDEGYPILFHHHRRRNADWSAAA